ncbi:MAG: hypothetical protein U0892_06985 [Pirellulales bacterium]
MHSGARFKATCVLCLFLISTIMGCGGKSIESYNPKRDAARQAIEKALDAWKSGKSLSPVDGKPTVNTFDARWQAGSKLESYTVLEEVPEQEHPQFKVRIKLVGKQEETNEYLVIGIDPLLVFRAEDYKKTSGM